jgi:hypothetical protein
MDQASAIRWTPVASFLGLDGDVQADLLVTNLQGLGVPAQRLPVLPTTTLPMASWPMIQRVMVCVPGDREEDARGIVADQPDAPMRPQLRTLIQWGAVGGYAGLLAAVFGVPAMLRGGANPPWPRPLAIVATFALIMGLRASVVLVLALRRERQRLLGVWPVLIALVLGGLFALLGALFEWVHGVDHRGFNLDLTEVDPAWRLVMAVGVIVAVAAVAAHRLRERKP